MSAKTKVSAIDHATHIAHTWVNDVAKEFDTDDREFAYGVLRAQLPDLIRGIFYAGWDPGAVPEKYDAEAYAVRFAGEANISRQDVGKAAAATTAALLHHVPSAQMEKALCQLPREIRVVLRPEPPSGRH